MNISGSNTAVSSWTTTSVVSNELVFSYGGTGVAKIKTTGEIVSADDITAPRKRAFQMAFSAEFWCNQFKRNSFTVWRHRTAQLEGLLSQRHNLWPYTVSTQNISDKRCDWANKAPFLVVLNPATETYESGCLICLTKTDLASPHKAAQAVAAPSSISALQML